ncbi:phosphoenolpyruvate--protein phosphotransferase [Motiliproteus sp. SC1-56]|uniref:phosphoenolpyruvate--protein phosphotransferase n=1 Tax=Motiliproteus sp. SC1-56 TaxID=2799565 RepID=UPI001A8D94B6|nr:phosphoenolpyruvate--protein phosphotransferase [Motiliproteus sp. SC1-56]
MQHHDPSLILRGTPISPGLAQGLTHVLRDLLGPIDTPVDIEHSQVEQELVRLDCATASISDDLVVLATRVKKEIDSRLSEVFGSHRLMLNDPSLQQELRREVADNLVSAGSAVKAVFLRWERRFLALESQIAREKGEDMRDISIRLHNALAGVTVHPLDQIPPGCVLVASRLLPTDSVFLAHCAIAGVLLEHGSSGSHAALFVRQLGLPCISGIPDLMGRVPDATLALLDADAGTVTVRPKRTQQIAFHRLTEEKARAYRVARENARRPAVTRDGVTVSVVANVGSSSDTQLAIVNGAEGVGLYRMEQAYLGRMTPPTTTELVDEMTQVLAAAKGLPVCVRLLDVGADKPLPFLAFFAESNPALGRRGIRLLREYPELLRTQLRAVMALSRDFDVRILVPMVALPEDMAAVTEVLRQLWPEPQTAVPKIGAMIETPAAALSARAIAEHADFLSFGTNDLTQYTFAADRDNAAVERYFNDSAAVIFRLLRLVHDDVPQMPLSVCGELAGRPEHVAKLLACGIRTFSVAAPLVPIVKAAIRQCSCCPDRAL